MKKILIITSVSILSISSVYSVNSLAQDSKKENPIAHYKADKIENIEQAYKALDKETTIISNILKKEKELDSITFERIHKISYTLEAAIDKIRDKKAVKEGKMDALDEDVQGIHYSAENQKEADLRKWFDSLLLDIDSERQDKYADSKPVKKEFYEIIIKDHKFSPVETIVPAGVKVKLKIANQDPTPEEFESHDMNREKIIRGNKTATIFVGPLKPGKYHFFGEFNTGKANGYIIAK